MVTLLWSCRPGEDAAWLLGFHPQRHQARRLVFSVVPLDGRGPKASWEAVEGVEAVDARMVRWVMVVVVGMTGGCGHAHEALQIAVGVSVRTHAG